MARLQWQTERLDSGAAALSGKAEAGRHFLEGRPVHCGDLLELLLEDGPWLLGRYEWSPETGAVLEEAGGDVHELSAESELRWPVR